MKLLLTICISFIMTVVHAQSSADIKLYILNFKDIALEHERKYGITASITLAQGEVL